MKKWTIAAAAMAIFVILVTGGVFIYRYFLAYRTMDGGTGMENPDAPMMELLSGSWAAADGQWTASINGYDIILFLEDTQVLDTSFSFSFDGDVNTKTELLLANHGMYGSHIQSEDESISGYIQDFYTENGRLYMTVDLGGNSSASVIMDRRHDITSDGTEAPMDPLDGDRTYVDNGALFDRIAGDWYSTDGHWRIMISGEANDACMELKLDGAAVLETTLDYCYLLPNPYSHTEFTLSAWECSRKGEDTFAEIVSLCHETGDGSGKLIMTLNRGDVQEELEFYQQSK